MLGYVWLIKILNNSSTTLLLYYYFVSTEKPTIPLVAEVKLPAATRSQPRKKSIICLQAYGYPGTIFQLSS